MFPRKPKSNDVNSTNVDGIQKSADIHTHIESGSDLMQRHDHLNEQALINNILGLKDLRVVDIMIPRVDIVALDIETPKSDLMDLLSEKQFSRFPVFQDDLDNVTGIVHVKDILAALAKSNEIDIPTLTRDVSIVSPSMGILDLLLEMRTTRKHMALVVDEYGGIDGLVTIGDIVEAIIGRIDDEHAQSDYYDMHYNADTNSLVTDARLPVEDFEAQFGDLFTEDERDDSDTIGGIVFSMAGRVPARGEILHHENGLIFEILDADPRRVKHIRIKNLPKNLNADDS
jgi:magnesium and cobalt transporter